jgi:hypothetical protein
MAIHLSNEKGNMNADLCIGIVSRHGIYQMAALSLALVLYAEHTV